MAADFAIICKVTANLAAAAADAAINGWSCRWKMELMSTKFSDSFDHDASGLYRSAVDGLSLTTHEKLDNDDGNSS